MFCGRCGAPIPANASFCPRCGNAVVVPQRSAAPTTLPVSDLVPDSCEPTKQELIPDSVKALDKNDILPTQPQPQTVKNATETSSVPRLKGAGRGRYALTVVLAIIFGGLLASNLFVFLSEVDSNPEKAGESVGKSIIPLVFWFAMVALAWRGIKSREPNSESQFRLRHKFFKTATSVLVAVLVLVGLALGIWNSHRIKVVDAIRKMAADNADLQAKGTEFRHQLYQIRHRETPTMQDYYDQCTEVETLLNDYEPIRERASLLIQKLRQTLPADDQSSAAMLNGVDELLRLDDQVIRDLRQEIAYSKVVITLPARQQGKFYSESIVPLQTHEDALIDKETKKVEDLRSIGVQLPADLLQK
jgi:hypothetical protein